MKTIYIISPKIKWRAFKMLQDKFVPKDGIYPMHIDKMLWQMLKERKINCWFEEEGDMAIGKLPKFKGENVKIIK